MACVPDKFWISFFLSSPRKRRAVRGNSQVPQALSSPTKAGTHTALPQNGPSRRAHVAAATQERCRRSALAERLGPRFRGDDKEILSLGAGIQMLDTSKSAPCSKVPWLSADSPALVAGTTRLAARMRPDPIRHSLQAGKTGLARSPEGHRCGHAPRHDEGRKNQSGRSLGDRPPQRQMEVAASVSRTGP